jgi:hypothetical protein
MVHLLLLFNSALGKGLSPLQINLYMALAVAAGVIPDISMIFPFVGHVDDWRVGGAMADRST